MIESLSRLNFYLQKNQKTHVHSLPMQPQQWLWTCVFYLDVNCLVLSRWPHPTPLPLSLSYLWIRRTTRWHCCLISQSRCVRAVLSMGMRWCRERSKISVEHLGFFPSASLEPSHVYRLYHNLADAEKVEQKIYYHALLKKWCHKEPKSRALRMSRAWKAHEVFMAGSQTWVCCQDLERTRPHLLITLPCH